MANSLSSLRISLTETAHGAGGVLPARPRAGLALVADRSIPAKAVPPGYALTADAGAPAEAPPPAQALAVDKQPGAAKARFHRPPYRSIGAAAVIHLALLVSLIVHPGPAKELGMEHGLPEALNVSIISSADLKRLSSDPTERDTPPPAPAPTPEIPAPPQPEPQPPVPPQTAEQLAMAEPSPPQPQASEPREAPYDPSQFIEMASRQFSAQLDHAFKAVEQRQQVRHEAAAKPIALTPSGPAMTRPGATHVGKSDEFALAVYWALYATKPMSNGKYGTTIVTFVVTDAGRLEGLTMLKSSGDNWLDTAALMSVRQARLPKPPHPLPLGDRTFVIRYISLQMR